MSLGQDVRRKDGETILHEGMRVKCKRKEDNEVSLKISESQKRIEPWENTASVHTQVSSDLQVQQNREKNKQ